MIVSRTMRLSDYGELANELALVDEVIRYVGFDPAQHPHRKWEYALALRAVDEHFGSRMYKQPDGEHLSVADFGCAIGLMSPIMVYLGHDIYMYEPWSWGNQEAQCMRQCDAAQRNSKTPGNYSICHRDLSHLAPEDKGRFDISFCISTMEHVPNEVEAMNDLFDSVARGGMTFLTMDYGPDDTDHYISRQVRARIYNANKMNHLVELGKAKVFSLLGGASDWTWNDGMKLVNDHGFGSVCMVRD